MSSLAEAKKALQFNREFTGLVDILKGIAASQFQALMRKKRRFEKFADSFDGFFKLADLAEIDSPFVRSHSVATQSEVTGRISASGAPSAGSPATGVLMATSDEGFMGDLNTKVVEAALRESGSGKKELFVTGSHGSDAMKERGLEAFVFPGIEYEKRYEQALEIKNRLISDVAARKFGRLTVTYAHPVSFTVQKAVTVQLLPCAELFKKPDTPPLPQGKLAHLHSRVILESKPEKIIEYLAGIWITTRLCDFFEDSKLSSLAAKTIHLEQSHDRLTEQGKLLKYRYFRARRELIDKGTRETFASILLRRNLEDECGGEDEA